MAKKALLLGALLFVAPLDSGADVAPDEAAAQHVQKGAGDEEDVVYYYTDDEEDLIYTDYSDVDSSVADFRQWYEEEFGVKLPPLRPRRPAVRPSSNAGPP
ncbi:hypothetical protein [Sorangium sp. So ce1153]|uniref:hypothetical protein n=1 Tax=Sorangium sp. So ce1153 TaxID=3133333 RepID=UPI003F647F9D